MPVLLGRALAQRLRVQAERLVAAIEGADRVDPAALAEALRLLGEARAEQNIRRTRKRRPPDPAPALAESGPSPAGAESAQAGTPALAGELDPTALAPRRQDKRPRKTLRRVKNPSRHDRESAALKGWRKRYSRLDRHHAWMLEKE